MNTTTVTKKTLRYIIVRVYGVTCLLLQLLNSLVLISCLGLLSLDNFILIFKVDVVGVSLLFHLDFFI